MRIVLSLILTSATLAIAGCGKSTPLPEPTKNEVTQLPAGCAPVKTEGETQTFRCPPSTKLELRSLGNDELTGPPCFINNERKAGASFIYAVVCPPGVRYDPKKPEQWVGLFYDG